MRELWRILGPKRNEVTGVWRKLYNEDRMGMAYSRDGEKEESI
jgi:hypothetical protein